MDRVRVRRRVGVGGWFGGVVVGGGWVLIFAKGGG